MLVANQFSRRFPKGLCETVMQLPLPIQHTLYNVATIGRHYTHRNPRSQTIRALIYARHQNHAPQSGAIVFLLLTIFFISLFFLFSITMRPDRPFDRDTVPRIGRHNLDVYFSGQRGQGGPARLGGPVAAAGRYSLGAIFKN